MDDSEALLTLLMLLSNHCSCFKSQETCNVLLNDVTSNETGVRANTTLATITYFHACFFCSVTEAQAHFKSSCS